jgi:hypothetical protein
MVAVLEITPICSLGNKLIFNPQYYNITQLYATYTSNKTLNKNPFLYHHVSLFSEHSELPTTMLLSTANHVAQSKIIFLSCLPDEEKRKFPKGGGFIY